MSGGYREHMELLFEGYGELQLFKVESSGDGYETSLVALD